MILSHHYVVFEKRPQPTFDPRFHEDGVDVYNFTLDYIIGHLGEPLVPSKVLDHLTHLGIKTPLGEGRDDKMNDLLDVWQEELQDHLADEGLTGRWTWNTREQHFTFRPHKDSLRVFNILQSQRTAPTHDTETIRKDVWGDGAEPTKPPKDPDVLTRAEASLMQYLARLAAREGVVYPAKKQLENLIVEKSRGTTVECVRDLIGDLVTREFLFCYKEGRQTFVTPNANVAYEANKRTSNENPVVAYAKEVAKNPVDAVAILDILSGGEAEQKLTLQQLWARLKLRRGEVVLHENVSDAEKTALKATIKVLVSAGMVRNGSYNAQARGHSIRRRVYKVGFADLTNYQEYRAMNTKASKTAYVSARILHSLEKK